MKYISKPAAILICGILVSVIAAAYLRSAQAQVSGDCQIVVEEYQKEMVSRVESLLSRGYKVQGFTSHRGGELVALMCR